MNRNNIPINRINKFFSSSDFELEISMGREAIEGDGNFTIVLYRVNRNQTQFDNIYGEAPDGGIKYYPPVELRVIPILQDPENKAYNPNGSMRYLQDGEFTFGIYDKQLTDEEVEISYGDYIGYAVDETTVRFYTVVNDGKKNFDNRHTIMGYKGAFRTITCAPVDSNEFSAK